LRAKNLSYNQKAAFVKLKHWFSFNETEIKRGLIANGILLKASSYTRCNASSSGGKRKLKPPEMAELSEKWQINTRLIQEMNQKDFENSCFADNYDAGFIFIRPNIV